MLLTLLFWFFCFGAFLACMGARWTSEREGWELIVAFTIAPGFLLFYIGVAIVFFVQEKFGGK